MKHILWIFVLMFSLQAQAFLPGLMGSSGAKLGGGSMGCPKSASSNHMVITLEGLGGRFLGSPALQLAKRANKSDYQIASYSWWNDMSSIAKCVNDWKQQAGPNAKVSIIGHSLGGGKVNDLADALASHGITVNDAFVFDGREGTEGVCGGPSSNPRYEKPKNVVRISNFYQCGSLPGRYYTPGPGVLNIAMLSSSHIDLPSTNYATRHAIDYLNADNGATDMQIASGTSSMEKPINSGFLPASYRGPASERRPTTSH